MTTLNFYINTFSKAMQASPASGSIFTPPPFYQGDILPVQVQILTPNSAGGANSYTFPDISNTSIEATMGAQPVGNVADAPFMTQYAWTKNIANGIFTANFDFTSASVDAFVGSAPNRQAWLQFTILEGASKQTIWGGLVQINATAIKNVAPGAPPPGQINLTLQDALQRFPQFKRLAGQQDTWLSPDGTRQRIIGVNNDGTGLDDLV